MGFGTSPFGTSPFGTTDESAGGVGLLNGSIEFFETFRWRPESWALNVVTVGSMDFAEFADLDAEIGTSGFEPFDWVQYVAAFAGLLIDITPRFFDPSGTVPQEDFDDGWGGTYAEVVSTDGPFALAHLDTLTVRIDAGPEQTITFDQASFPDITEAFPEEVARAVAEQLTGATAVLFEAAVKLITYKAGVTGSVQVTGGTANAALGFPVTLQTGSNSSGQYLPSVEYSFQSFSGADNDPFDTGWEGAGALDVAADPDDSSGRLTLMDFVGPVAFESFDDWGGPVDGVLVPTFAVIDATDAEAFEGTWTAF